MTEHAYECGVPRVDVTCRDGCSCSCHRPTFRIKTAKGDYATPDPDSGPCSRCHRPFLVDSRGDMAEQEVLVRGSDLGTHAATHVHMRCKRPDDVVHWDMAEANAGLPLDLVVQSTKAHMEGS